VISGIPNLIIKFTGIKTDLCNGSLGFNHQYGYYVSPKVEFVKTFASLQIKTVGMDMKEPRLPTKKILKNNL